MSSLTNFLKLFKWDVNTDGSQKFNIDKCMNGNWDKLDTYLENLEIGGRNLLLDSKREITNSSYIIAEYTLTEKPIDGEEYTLTLKGSLGQGKTAFRIFNSGGSVNVTSLVYDNEKDIYKSTFNWTSANSNGTTANNTFIRIYAANSSVTAESSIKWVKLEKGNKATDWTPAPEDKANLTDLDTKMNLHRDTKALTAKGWYRVAEFVNTGIYIVNITQRWNETRPSSCLLLVNVGAQKFNISILDSEFVNTTNAIGISQLRLVKDVDSASASAFLEIYYNYNVSNNITVQIINESIDTSSVNTIHFTETTSEDIFVKATKDMKILHLDDAINTNKTAIGTLTSLTSSDKTSLVNALNELRLISLSYMRGQSLADTTILTNKTFDGALNLGFSSIFTINGNEEVTNGDGFPQEAYKYGLLITFYSYATYAKTQIYITDGNRGIYWRTRLGGSWNCIKQHKITTGTEFATDEYIDNERVYRKRVNCGALPNATAKSVAHGLSNVTFVKPPQGLAKNSNGTVLTLPYSAPNGTEYSVALSVNNANIQISAGNDRSAYTECYVDLYYTKN